MTDDYLTTVEFCKRYHVSPRTAERWRTSGHGPPFVRVGPRKIVYRTANAEAWAAQRTYQHRAAELATAPRPASDGT
jgi:predicted DNA-binding transcriptional regulator AlpA